MAGWLPCKPGKQVRILIGPGSFRFVNYKYKGCVEITRT